MGGTFTTSRAARAEFVPADADGVLLQYGVRLDAERVGPVHAATAADEISPAARVNAGSVRQSLQSVAVSPMLGVTWTRGAFATYSGPATYYGARTRVTGGVRMYQGVMPLERLALAEARNATAAAGGELRCVGAAAPPLVWERLVAQGPPTATVCRAAPQALQLQDARPSTSGVDAGFRPVRSVRGEAQAQQMLWGDLSATLGLTLVRNQRMPGMVDANFSGRVWGRLPEEQGRPMFTPWSAIDPPTGAVGIVGSRRDSLAGYAEVVQSSLWSSLGQVTLGVEYRAGAGRPRSPAIVAPPAVALTARTHYVLSIDRGVASGFTSSTADDPRQHTPVGGSVPRHTVQTQLELRWDGWATARIFARASSGRRFTPIVDQDVNGDGFVNDRAFVPPAGWTGSYPSDAEVQRLMEGAPARLRRCLEAQRGTIAAPASCAGPWTATVGAVALSLAPERLRRDRRVELSVYVHDALAGLDRLLHGSRDLRGWGQSTPVDPVLLQVERFDPATSQYRYSLNPRFGRPREVGWWDGALPRLTVELRMDLGPDREALAMREYLRDLVRDSPWSAHELAHRLLADAGGSETSSLRDMLRLADTLDLRQEQVYLLNRLRLRDSTSRDSLYRDLATSLTSKAALRVDADARRRWRSAILQSAQRRHDVTEEALALLSGRQRALLAKTSVAGRGAFGREWLARVRRQPLLPR